MKKNILFAFCLSCLSFLIGSCGPTEYQQLEKLIDEHKYEEARQFVKENFYGNSRSARLAEVAEAQLEDFYEEHDYKEIKELKKELKSPFAYQRTFSNNFKDVLKMGNYDFIFETFEEWEIHYEYHNAFDSYEKNKDGYLDEPKVYDDDFMWDVASGHQSTYCNGEYNAEVRFLNTMIDRTLERLIEENDIENIKNLINFYKPYSALKSITKNKNAGMLDSPDHFEWELQNTAKDEALKKIKEANIKL